MWLILVALAVSIWAVLRLTRGNGITVRLLCLVLLIQSISGLPLRLSSALSSVTRVATLAVIVLGAIAVLRGATKPLATVAKVAGVVSIGIATAFLFVRVSASPSFAFAGWVSVTAPVFAVAAGTVVWRDEGRPGLDALLRTLALGAVVNLVFAFKQIVFGFSAAEIRAVTSNDSTYSVGAQVRLIGALPSNQDFALYAGVIAPGVLALALWSHRRYRTVTLLLAVALYLALLLSLSRGAIIGATMAGAVVMFAAVHRRNLKVVPIFARLFTIVAVVVVAGLLLVPGDRVSSAVGRVGSLVRLHEDVSYNARVSSTYPLAISTVLHHPFGLGGGAAGPVSQKYPTDAPQGALVADDAYLTIAIQLGVIGMLVVIAAGLAMTFRLARARTAAGVVGATVLCSLLVCFVTGGDWNLSGPMSVIGIGLGCFAVSETPIVARRPLANQSLKHR